MFQSPFHVHLTIVVLIVAMDIGRTLDHRKTTCRVGISLRSERQE